MAATWREAGRPSALIIGNRATVERARTHVGHLAHALKTPFAVLRNALDRTEPDVVAAGMEAASLERLVHHHLVRAHAAARMAASAPASVAPLPVAEEVASGGGCGGSSTRAPS